MNRYIAFLRAINVGGHNVRMNELRRHFEDLGFDEVATFIASGNVIFGAADPDVGGLESAIEAHLEARLGYEVATFIRSIEEVRGIPARQPFPQEALEPEAHRLYVGFLRDEPRPSAAAALRALGSETDSLDVVGRELFWLSRVPSRDSPVSGALMEKAGVGPATLRNINTINRLIARYCE